VPSVASQSAESIETRRIPRRRTVLKLVVAAALCVVLLLWVELWPFQQKSVVQNLEEASDSKLRLRAFYRTYFPFPGSVLEGLEFYHGSNTTKPLITIEKLIIRGSYFGILSRRLTRITAENMHVLIPPFGSGETFHTTPSKITIDEIVANDAVLEFALRKPDKQPLRFEIHEALLRDVGWKGARTEGLLGSFVQDWPSTAFNLLKDFPDVMCQQNDNAANATNPEEKVGRQLGGIDLLFVHRRGCLPADGT
jgi:hypothetical protein